MKKTTLAILFTVAFSTGQVIAQDVNETAQEMSDEEIQKMIAETIKFQQEIEESEKRIAAAKAKTEAVMKLGKTVDELAKELGVNE